MNWNLDFMGQDQQQQSRLFPAEPALPPVPGLTLDDALELERDLELLTISSAEVGRMMSSDSRIATVSTKTNTRIYNLL